MDTNTTNTNPMENNIPTAPLANLASSTGQANFGQKKNNPVWLIVVAAAVLVLIVWWINRSPGIQEAVKPTITPTPILVQDELQQEVEALDLGDVNSEFDQIDQDLNTL